MFVNRIITLCVMSRPVFVLCTTVRPADPQCPRGMSGGGRPSVGSEWAVGVWRRSG